MYALVSRDWNCCKAFTNHYKPLQAFSGIILFDMELLNKT